MKSRMTDMKREEKILAKSREQRAGSLEQRVIGDWSLVFGKHELSGDLSLDSHFSFLTPYSLFLELRLKPFSEFNYSFRQLKLTAKNRAMRYLKALSIAVDFNLRQLKLTAKDRAMRYLMALSIAVGFSQRTQKETKREENIEYGISNIEFRSGASNQVSHFSFLTPYSLFLELRLKPMLGFISFIRQLKLTAKDNSLPGTKSRNQASNILYPVSTVAQSLTGRQQEVASSKLLFNRDSTVYNYKQFSFNPAARRDSGAPCRQLRFAGYFLSIMFLQMRELKQVLTKKVLFALPPNKSGGLGGGLNQPMKHAW